MIPQLADQFTKVDLGRQSGAKRSSNLFEGFDWQDRMNLKTLDVATGAAIPRLLVLAGKPQVPEENSPKLAKLAIKGPMPRQPENSWIPNSWSAGGTNQPRHR